MIRIQLVAMENILSDMITDLLASEPDITVVGRARTIGEAMTPARAEPTDVLLLQDGRAGEGLMTVMLSPRPPAILCIAANGREGWTVRIDADRLPIAAEHGGLAAAVRRAVDHHS